MKRLSVVLLVVSLAMLIASPVLAGPFGIASRGEMQPRYWVNAGHGPNKVQIRVYDMPMGNMLRVPGQLAMVEIVDPLGKSSIYYAQAQYVEGLLHKILEGAAAGGLIGRGLYHTPADAISGVSSSTSTSGAVANAKAAAKTKTVILNTKVTVPGGKPHHCK